MPSKRMQQETYNAAVLQLFHIAISNLPLGIRFQAKIKSLQSLMTNWNLKLRNTSIT